MKKQISLKNNLQQITLLTKSINTLKKQLRSEKNNSCSLSQNIKQLKAQYKQKLNLKTEKELSLKNNQQISLLTKTIETLKKQLHSEQNNSRSLSQNIKEIKAQYKQKLNLKTAHYQLQIETEILKSIETLLIYKYPKDESLIDIIKQELLELKKENILLKETINNIQKSSYCSKLKNLIDYYNNRPELSELTKKKQLITKLNDRLLRLEKKYAHSQQQLYDQKNKHLEQIKDILKQLHNANEFNKSLQKTRQHLQSQLDIIAEENKRLKIETNLNKSNYNALNLKLNSKIISHQKLNEKLTKLNNKYNKLLQQFKTEINKEHQDLLSRIKSQHDIIMHQDRTIQEYKDTEDQLIAENEGYQLHCQSLEDQFKTFSASLQKKSQMNLNQLKESHSKTHQDNDNLQKVIFSLQSSLHHANISLKSKEKCTTNVEKKVTRLTNQIKRQQEQIEHYKKENRLLTTTNSQLKSKLKHLELEHLTTTNNLIQNDPDSEINNKTIQQQTTEKKQLKLGANATTTFNNIFVNNKKEISYSNLKTMLNQMGEKGIFVSPVTFNNKRGNGSHIQCTFSIETEDGNNDYKSITLAQHANILSPVSVKSLKDNLKDYPSIQALVDNQFQQS
ncbi:hypothetical protein DID75_02090 [Candidatus Marinamargulisbacteria bacterium SCGC AG-410-N11]|nr:hypothetical protein DID75_02090 [Candidatus Marinamargulisbacteria bacterium SCGC AG-410-N11]